VETSFFYFKGIQGIGMKSVVLAFSNPILTNWVSTVLTRSGYHIENVCKTGSDLIRVSEFCTSPVAVCGFQFPDMTAENLFTLLEGRLALVTVVLSHQRDILNRDDMLLVPYPMSAADLIGAIEVMERSAAFRAVSSRQDSAGKSAFQPKERPAEEKLIILKAKEMLMEANAMTESQAHRFLQKTSMDRGLRLIDAATMVIAGTLAV